MEAIATINEDLARFDYKTVKKLSFFQNPTTFQLVTVERLVIVHSRQGFSCFYKWAPLFMVSKEQMELVAGYFQILQQCKILHNNNANFKERNKKKPYIYNKRP